jgi:hypothetical protein
MTLLSAVCLLAEITFSMFSYNTVAVFNRESKSSKKFNFTYKSKCADVKTVVNQLEIFRNNLFYDYDDLNISFLEAAKIPSGDVFEIFISFEFELNNSGRIGQIVSQFDAFTADLDSLSHT